MNKKGFTLVELLATLLILVTISLVAVFNITSSLERRDKKEQIEQENLAKNAAKIYFSLSKEDTTCVTVKFLVENGYLKKEKADKIGNGSITLSKENGEYIFNPEMICN